MLQLTRIHLIQFGKRFYSSSKSVLPKTSEVVVIGGGVIGASTAYHLAKRGLQVTLLERHKLTSGTTWHSAAMMNCISGSPHFNQLVKYTRDLVSSGILEEETGVSPGWKRHGGLSITADEDRLKEFKMMHALGNYQEIDVKMVNPEEIKQLHPLINTDGLVGGIYQGSDGSIDPTGLTNAFAKGAKLNGAVIFEDCPVSNINLNTTNSVQSVSVGNEKILTNCVVLAAGAWSKDLAKKIDIEIPTMVNKHSYVVSDIIPGISSYPNVRYFDESIYFKVQNDTIYMGAFEANPVFVEIDPELVYGLYDFDWDVYMPYLNEHMKLMPKLAEVGTKTIICGPESFTPDSQPIFGADSQVDGLYYNTNMCSRGIQLSGGMGREMANLIVSGCTDVDMFSYDINRFHRSYLTNEKWQKESIHEAEVLTYWVKYPTLQRMSGRNLKHSPVHQKMAENGAFFGSAGGYERPLFFLKNNKQLEVPEYDWYGFYGHKRSPSTYESIMRDEYAKWSYSPRISKAIQTEVENCRKHAAIFDLSSFGKVSVSGEGALNALEWLCTAPMDNPIGTSKYSLMLNESGGIEADITVTRISNNEFYVVTGSSFTQYLLALMQKKVSQRFPMTNIIDVTDEIAILSLQGPQSHNILQNNCATPDDQQKLSQLQYGQSDLIWMKTNEGHICQVRAMRMSYVGELGYELHIKSSGKGITSIFETLYSAKNVSLAGFEALNSMSLEKGHRHWHGDIETTDHPVEAGLMFACSSLSNFQGKCQLTNRRPSKKLATFTVDPKVPLNGHEIIHRNGNAVGYLSRGGFGYSINKSLGTGYVDLQSKAEDQSVRDFVLKGHYQIDVMGKMHDAEISLKPLFDPKKNKMKLC